MPKVSAPQFAFLTYIYIYIYIYHNIMYDTGGAEAGPVPPGQGGAAGERQ